MDTLYRGMASEADWADGLVLWEKVFNVGPWLFHTLHRGHEDRLLSDCSAACCEGELVSAVDFFIRDTWDAQGAARRMGGIGSVATLPEHRRKGHSSVLLDMALERMEARGCDWSILFTGTNSHYARKGWRTFERDACRVELASSYPAAPEEWSIEVKTHWAPSEPMILAPLHEAEFRSCPTAAVRTPLSWRVSVRERMNRPGIHSILARREGALEAYAIAALEEESFGLIELAGSPEGKKAACASLFGILKERGLSQGHVQLPLSFMEREELAELFPKTSIHKTGHTMARPIADRMSWEAIEAAFASPDGAHLRLDDF